MLALMELSFELGKTMNKCERQLMDSGDPSGEVRQIIKKIEKDLSEVKDKIIKMK